MVSHKILVVDDSDSFRETFAKWLQNTLGPQTEVLTAAEAGTCLKILQSKLVDMVIIDMEMPVLDGAQLLSLINKTHSDILKVILSGYPVDELGKADLKANGAAAILQKTPGTNGLESIRMVIESLLADKNDHAGFHTTLKKANLPEVIQMQCISMASCVCLIKGPMETGRIYILNGEIIHAEYAGFPPDEACYEVLSLKGGKLQIEDYKSPAQRTLQTSWQHLLLEAARRSDESQDTTSDQSAPPPPQPPEPSQKIKPPPPTESMNSKEKSLFAQYTNFTK